MSSTKINDGGPAFPTGYRTEVIGKDGTTAFTMPTLFHGGMTLRDYFAAKAMHSIRTGPEWVLMEMKTIAAENGTRLQDVVAHFAYEQADAMLAKRNAQGANQ